MVFDAAALWWPPFSKLYNQLETLKLEPGAVAAETLKATLKGGWSCGGGGPSLGVPNSSSDNALGS